MEKTVIENIEGIMVSVENTAQKIFGKISNETKKVLEPQGKINVDVKKYSDRYEVLADLPNIDKENVEVSYDFGTKVLTISVKTLEIEKETDFEYTAKERDLSGVKRQFKVPNGKENIFAKFENGVLLIVIEVEKNSGSKVKIE